ncbi:MAG: multiheme c-type cytochrome, partial [Candidatus Sedimenticola sp. (ex Thyasira tokunagai)]
AQLMLKERAGPIGLLLGILCLAADFALAVEAIPAGPFTEAECITCHTERDPELIRQWREGPHSDASGIKCSSCHGDLHESSAIRARKDLSCSGCHEGPASHSYTTSKHGVINRLEGARLDWRQPLQRGNYRAPGCAYCHLHNGDHGDTMEPERGPEVRQWICSECHSPRYIREQFANGKRQLAIADLKLTEGESLMAAADRQIDRLSTLRQSLIQHRTNVLLGIGHQSPDYQWWHGQPAMDGDLIRIRDAISESYRRTILMVSPND